MKELNEQTKLAPSFTQWAVSFGLVSLAFLVSTVVSPFWFQTTTNLVLLFVSIAPGVSYVGCALLWLIPKHLLAGRVEQVPRREGWAYLATGCALLASGLATTAVSYSAAAPGGQYMVASGLLAFGIVGISQGLGTLLLGSRTVGVVVAIYGLVAALGYALWSLATSS